VLTGLYNRRHLLERLEVEKSRADRNRKSFSVVILDIDHFKQINDTYGHMHGDEVIKAIAQVLQRACANQTFAPVLAAKSLSWC
jgi:diguanylate cyclase